jgi:acyl transferase domain-containing protein
VASALGSNPLDTATMDADYWCRNLREPVRFHDTVTGLLTAGDQVFVEISPQPMLAAAIVESLGEHPERSSSAVIATLRIDRGDLAALSAALGQLHNHGHSPSWPMLYPNAQIVPLPT